MLQGIKAKRDWVRNHYTPETINEYETIEGKFKLLDVILKSCWYQKHETLNLQSLGMTLGDIFVQDMGFKQVEIVDEIGETAAVKFADTSIILYPVTMISKRMGRDEEIDIYDLYDKVKQKVQELKLNSDTK